MTTCHHHSIVALESHGYGPGPNAAGFPVPIRLHEVTCVFEDDPTSDDAIVVGQVWLEDGEAEDGFPCPVCGDEITMAVPDAPTRPLTVAEADLMFRSIDETRAQWTEHYQPAAPPCRIPEGK